MSPSPRRPSSSPLAGRPVGKAPVRLAVRNFKGIAAVHLPDTRLTVLAGSNSSGKSSLLQAVLFLAQSVGQSWPGAVVNGDLVRLGEPRDVIRSGADEVALSFSFSESGTETPGEYEAELVLTADEQYLRPVRFSLWVDGDHYLEASRSACDPSLSSLLRSTEFALRIEDSEPLGLSNEAYLTVFGLLPGRLAYRASPDVYRKVFDRFFEEESIHRYLLEDALRVAAARSTQAHLPEALKQKVNELRNAPYSQTKYTTRERDALFHFLYDLEAPSGWANEGISLGPLGSGRSGLGPAVHGTEASAITTVVRHLTNLSRRIETLARSVVYLGPLRDDPRVAYPLGHTVTSLPVGEKGEFTAAYLEQHAGRRITYWSPDGRRTSDLLPAAVSKWSAHLGIADQVSVEPKGKLGHELRLTIHGEDRDPTAVGVGASQLLPVIVLVLGAGAGSLALLEQPELHLHPKVQSRLGDFFARARPDIRLLVETHSEYLLTRLRLRAAQGSLRAEDLAVLFARQRVVEHPYETDAGDHGVEVTAYSEFRRLALDRHGDFNAWPDDFFDTLGNDAVEIARAVSQRLAEERRGRDL